MVFTRFNDFNSWLERRKEKKMELRRVFSRSLFTSEVLFKNTVNDSMFIDINISVVSTISKLIIFHYNFISTFQAVFTLPRTLVIPVNWVVSPKAKRIYTIKLTWLESVLTPKACKEAKCRLNQKNRKQLYFTLSSYTHAFEIQPSVLYFSPYHYNNNLKI